MYDIKALKSELANLPESGMGYQIVDATMQDNRVERGIAYNGELLVLAEEAPVAITKSNFRALVLSAPLASGRVKFVTVLTHHRGLRLLKAKAMTSLGTYAASGPADQAPVGETKSGEVFKRFSAFEDDIRVRPDKSFTPGTYATTEEDAKNVKTGREAVKRYALANSDPASNVFTAKPNQKTKIQRGVVEPANGQPGEGVEVIFPEGTQVYTVTGPEKIPD